MRGVKLAPIQLEALASAVCGAEGTPVEYRTGEQLRRFRAFVRVDIEYDEGSSRFNDTLSYLDACNGMPPGASGLPRGVEKVVEALLDRRQFKNDALQGDAIAYVAEALASMPIEIRLGHRRSVELVNTSSTPGQEIVDREIRTVYEEMLKDSEFRAAREHYRKARQLVQASQPDYPNAAKEAVCSVESIARTLTGARDLNKAVTRAVGSDHIPAPLAELIKKLYAYRGDEPGVAHGNEEVPDVDQHDAQFVINLAAAIGIYLRGKLTEE